MDEAEEARQREMRRLAREIMSQEGAWRMLLEAAEYDADIADGVAMVQRLAAEDDS